MNSRSAYIISIAVLLIMYFIYSLILSQNIDFIAINGTFQNFNVIRRLFDGQIPYVDFSVYLGMGHLYISSFFTLIFGGDFAASVLAYHFISSAVVILTVYVFCGIIKKNNWVIPFTISNVVLLKNILFEADDAFVGGGSARLIRAAILPLSVLIFMIAGYFLKKSSGYNSLSENNRLLVNAVVLSFTAGISIVWSNDYGVAVWICIYLMTFFAVIVKTRNFIMFLKTALILLSGNLLTTFGIVSAATRGNFMLWLEKNFFTAGYQNWYYCSPWQKTFYLYQIDLSIPALICMIMTVMYCLLFILKRGSRDSDMHNWIYAFSLLVCLAATNEYKLLGGGGKVIHEMLMIVLVSVISAEIPMLIKKYEYAGKHGFSIAVISGELSLVLALTNVSCLIYNEPMTFRMFPDGTEYVPELGGKLNECYDDVKLSIDYLGSKKLFSTYSSAAEVITGQFQPTGTDYIIHCLSDESREKYLEEFRKGDFDCVSTVTEDYNYYSRWIRNANWFFYREVYKNYYPVAKNSYSVYWEKNDSDSPSTVYSEDIDVQIEKSNDSTYIVTVTAPAKINGIADVYIDYKVNKTGGFLMHNTVAGICADDPYYQWIKYQMDWALRPESKEYIPVEIIDGKGKITISGFPINNTTLTLNAVRCEEIFCIPEELTTMQVIEKTTAESE